MPVRVRSFLILVVSWGAQSTDSSFGGVAPKPGIEPGSCADARLWRAGKTRARCPRLADSTLPKHVRLLQGLGPAGVGLRMRQRGAEGFGRRVYSRASKTYSPCLFERNERSECSELHGATESRAPQRTRAAGVASAAPHRPAPSLAPAHNNASQIFPRCFNRDNVSADKFK